MASPKVPRWLTPERRAYMKAWHTANPTKSRIYGALRRKKHPGKDAAYYLANRERLRKQKAAHYAANRERILAKAQAYAEANRERVLEYHAAHYEKNAERLNAESAIYRKNNPAIVAHSARQRYARKRANGGTHTLEDLLEKFALLGDVCFYCGSDARLTADHDIPLVRGGTNDIGNILPACRRCNSKKHTRTASEFITYLYERPMQ